MKTHPRGLLKIDRALRTDTRKSKSVCGGEPGQPGQGVLQKKLIIILSLLSEISIKLPFELKSSSSAGQGWRMHHPVDTLPVFYRPDFICWEMGWDALFKLWNFTKVCCGRGISSRKQTNGKKKPKPKSQLPPDLCAFRMESAPFGPELGAGSPSNPACQGWVFLIHKYPAQLVCCGSATGGSRIN